MHRLINKKGLAVLMSIMLTAGTVFVPAAASQAEAGPWNDETEMEDRASGAEIIFSEEMDSAEETAGGLSDPAPSDDRTYGDGQEESFEDAGGSSAGSGREDADTDSVDPAPADPDPAEMDPADPDPVNTDPAGHDSVNAESAGFDPVDSDPEGIDPAGTDSTGSDFTGSDTTGSDSVDPEITGQDPAGTSSTESASAESLSSEPASTESASTEPAPGGDRFPENGESGAVPSPDPGAAADPADGEIYPEGTILTGSGRDQHYVPADEGVSPADNDDVFAAYVNRELGLSDDIKADTGSFTAKEPARKSNYAANKLTGANRTAYGLLLEGIRRVAQGKQVSTEFSLTMTQLGLNKVRWTAKDLGVSSIIKSGMITSEAIEAADRKVGIDLGLINRSLTADCPYDLYWYDGTKGVWQTAVWYAAEYIGSEWVIYPTDTIEFSFNVAKEYSASGQAGTFRVKAGIGESVAKAHDNALGIVEKYKDLSDYQKLDNYRREIQGMVEYNWDAAMNEDISYGNPWQLIWVFDGDPGTNVVCEGYSKAFQFLCDKSTFSNLVRDVICVTGSAFGGLHMWNLAILNDGRSYLCDLTNCEEGEYDPAAGGYLFLVGAQDPDAAGGADPTLATGSPDRGYRFNLENISEDVTYTYDEASFSNFSNEDLTLAPGRVTDQTVTGQVTTSRHSHVIVLDPYVAPTYTRTGKTTGSHCVICGQVRVAQTVIPKLIYVSSVKLNKASATVIKGKTLTLKATAAPSTAAKKTVTWKSSNTKVATVTAKGVVKGVGKGTATITATAADGSKKKAVCKVTVRVPVTGVKLNKKTPYILIGKTLALKATVAPSDATNKAVAWKSSNTKVATVSAKGVIRGVGKGTATITATTRDGAKKASCKVTVQIPVSKIRLSHSTYKINRGKKKTIRATVSPSNAANKSLTWTSSNPKIATVTSGGVVKGIKKGTVTITAAAKDGSGVKATCTVKVR